VPPRGESASATALAGAYRGLAETIAVRLETGSTDELGAAQAKALDAVGAARLSFSTSDEAAVWIPLGSALSGLLRIADSEIAVLVPGSKAPPAEESTPLLAAKETPEAPATAKAAPATKAAAPAAPADGSKWDTLIFALRVALHTAFASLWVRARRGYIS